MKVYLVSAGEVTECDYWQVEPPETYFLVELVAAPTRNKATYQVWKKHQRILGDLHEQHWQTVYLGNYKEVEAGILEDNTLLWRAVPRDLKLRP